MIIIKNKQLNFNKYNYIKKKIINFDKIQLKINI